MDPIFQIRPTGENCGAVPTGHGVDEIGMIQSPTRYMCRVVDIKLNDSHAGVL